MAKSPQIPPLARTKAEAIDRQLHKLDSVLFSSAPHPDYQEFWEQAQKILQLFKTSDPLLPADRQQLWQRFDLLCQDAKKKQQQEDEKRQAQSEQLKQWILSEIEKGNPSGSCRPGDRQLKDMGQALRHAAFLCSQHKPKMLASHRLECLTKLAEVEKLYELCHQQAKKEHRRQQRRAVIKAVDNLQRNRLRWDQAKTTLQRLQNDATELRLQLETTAPPALFRQRLERKLATTQERIREIDYSIQQIEAWIEADEKIRKQDGSC